MWYNFDKTTYSCFSFTQYYDGLQYTSVLTTATIVSSTTADEIFGHKEHTLCYFRPNIPLWALEMHVVIVLQVTTTTYVCITTDGIFGRKQ